MADETEIRNRLDAFFDILRSSGVTKMVNSFIPPSFTYRTNELSRILKDYGIVYVSTIFEDMETEGEKTEFAVIEDDVITVDRSNNLIPWDEADSDPRGLPVAKGIFGCHWPNVLNVNPGCHSETVDKWVEYFNKCADSFGVVLSRDMEFFATQALYRKYAKLEKCDGVWSVDITDVPLVPGRGKCFCISSKKKLFGCIGGEMEIYEKHGDFINYRITPNENLLKFI